MITLFLVEKGILKKPILYLSDFKEVENKLQRLGNRSVNAQPIINRLFHHPIINAQKAKELLPISLPTVYKLLDEMEKLNIIKEITGGNRGKQYVFEKYIELFE